MEDSSARSIESYPLLKEYPLSSSPLKFIPAQAQRGLSTFDIEFTCIDTDGHYIAIGTNIGITYLFDRRKNQLVRLRNEHRDAVTSVKVLISLDCLVVFGCKNGAVLLFKVPLSGDEEFEKCTVDGLHVSAITALEWDKSGQRFFSGDETGVIVCTEIEYFKHQSRSRVLLKEESTIVQLSYNDKWLLISTLLRAVIFSCENNSTTKIGQKERKYFGPFGAMVFPSYSEESVIYASRPGQRLWKSDKSGIIHETMIFKTALSGAHSVIPVCDDESKPCDFSDFQFGKLLCFSEKYILVFSDFAFVLIDPEQKSVISSSLSLFPVVDVATSNEEIFVLKGVREIIRISSYPDPYICAKIPEELSIMEEMLVPLKEFSTFVKERTDTFSTHAENSHLFDWLRKKRSSSSPATMDVNSSVVDPTEDSNEPLPQLVKLESGECTAVSMDTSLASIDSIISLDIKITEEENDAIVYKPKKKRNKNKKVRFRSKSPQKDESLILDKDTDVADSSITAGKANQETSGVNDSTNCEKPVGNVGVSNEENDKTSEAFDSASTISSDIFLSINETNSTNIDSNSNPADPDLYSTSANEPKEQNKESNSTKHVTEGKENMSANHTKGDDKEYDSDDFYYSFDPSSNTCLVKQPSNDSSSLDNSTGDSSSVSSEMPLSGPPKYGVDWVEYGTQDILLDLCISEHHIFCVDVLNHLYFSNYPVLGLQWRDLNQPAEKVSVSPSESVVWALYKGTVFAAVQKSTLPWFDVEWLSVARDVISIAVEDSCGWYVTYSGQLFVQQDLSIAKPFGYPTSIPCKHNLSQVASRNGVVWILDANRSLYYLDRRRLSKVKINPIEVKGVPDIDRVFLGVHQTGWIIDSYGTLRFLIGVTPSSPGGVGKPWEVEVSKYAVEQTSLKITETVTSLMKGRQHICLSTSSSGIWFCKTENDLIYANKKNVIGHVWDSFIPLGSSSSTKWCSISSSSITDSQGSLWCLTSTGELFCVSTSSKVPVTVELPSESSIKCFCPCESSLWVLTEKGDIFTRRDITDNCPGGVRWQKLTLEQLGDTQIISISCGSDVAWACTSTGDVYMRLGSLCPATTRSLPQAWIPISTGSQEVPSPLFDKLSLIGKRFPLPIIPQSCTEVSFQKIYVGPLGCPVWAIDNRRCVYVREGVSPSLPVGSKWTYVPELRAKELGISKNAVWLLKSSGKIFRRFNVSEKNPCGDYWKQIPGNMDHLTVTPDDDLWGLKGDRIFLHSSFVLSFSSNEIPQKSLPERSLSEDDWEDIMANVDGDE